MVEGRVDGLGGNLSVIDLYNVIGCGIIRKYGIVGGSVLLGVMALGVSLT